MPSGAKRRKAAKKKQGKLPNITNSSQQEQGNGDSPKSHDDKDSDSGSVSSPTAYQEHHNPLEKEESDEDEKFEQEPKDSSTVLQEPQDVEIEKSQFGGETEEEEKVVDIGRGGGGGEDSNLGDDGEVVVTKEVDYESRAIDIEPVKEPDVEIIKEEERTNGGVENSQMEEELSESKEEGKVDLDVVEINAAIDPDEEVVAVSKEVIHSPVNQDVLQSRNSGVSLEKKIGDSSGIETLLKGSEERMLPQSTGGVETSNGTAHPREVHTSTPNSDNQGKDVAPVPPTIRPTSWKSCCGLFDMLAGSNR